MEEKICKHCGRSFNPVRANHVYCTDSSCRRERKRIWQREKLKRDPDYRAAQQDAHARWLGKNPDYYRNYRRKNPAYARENRLKQRIRNRLKRGLLPAEVWEKIAKMDANEPVKPGYYCLLALNRDGAVIANMESRYVYLADVAPF